MSSFQNYIKTRSWSWWASNIALLTIVVLLLVPSWRKSVMVWITELRLGSPTLVSESQYQEMPEKAWLFSYKDLEGGEHFLKHHQGKVIFLNVWATWCPPCLAEMGSIKRLYDAYKKDVVFILYSREDPEVVRIFEKKKQYGLPFATMHYEGIPPTFHTSTYPSTFIITKDGKLALKEKGAVKWDGDEVKTLLKRLIKE